MFACFCQRSRHSTTEFSTALGVNIPTFVQHPQYRPSFTSCFSDTPPPMLVILVMCTWGVECYSCSVLKSDFLCSSSSLLFLLVMCTSLHVTSHFHSVTSCIFLHISCFSVITFTGENKKIIKRCCVISTLYIVFIFH